MTRRLGWRFAVFLTVAFATFALATRAQAGDILNLIQNRGRLTCGVAANEPGLSMRDQRGHYTGLEVDMCRAVAAAILGSADKVEFRSIDTIDNMLADPEIDIVFHGLTWTFAREMKFDVRFGPVVFYDGQTFMINRKLGLKNLSQLLGRTICVQSDSDAFTNLQRAYKERRMVLKTVLFNNLAETEAAFFAGKCDGLTADASELAAILIGRAKNPGDYQILPDRISKEPIAPLMRRDDDDFFDIVRWTIFATIEAEELGITAMNVDDMKKSSDMHIRDFLSAASERIGMSPGWTGTVIRNVGNYGEIYERNLGQGSPARLDRSIDDQWSKGGLMLAPPFK
jgi:general L-amino acid transport system substrate-binding protein